MSKTLITGVGLTSKKLSEFLSSKGISVQFLTRNPNKHPTLKCFKWDIENSYVDLDAFLDVDFVIHLTGAGIGDRRWTRKRKKEIIDSRIESTSLLHKTVKENNIPIKAFIAASAIGYYGAISTSTIFKEIDKPANDFLGKVCVAWEQEIQKFKDLQIRTVILRTGVVLTPKGGALSKIINPIQANVGAVLGKGTQIMPWIHINDLCNLYVTAIENKSIDGIFNAVAPSFNSNKEMTHLIAKKLDKYIWLPNIPIPILKILFGEMAVIFLYGSKVSCCKIEKKGFKFEFNTLDKALENLVSS